MCTVKCLTQHATLSDKGLELDSTSGAFAITPERGMISPTPQGRQNPSLSRPKFHTHIHVYILSTINSTEVGNHAPRWRQAVLSMEAADRYSLGRDMLPYFVRGNFGHSEVGGFNPYDSGMHQPSTLHTQISWKLK
jgi:hypothetical protein